MAVWESSHVVGQLGHHLFRDRPLCHGLACLAVLGSDGVSVEMDVAKAYGLDVSASKPCRHGQQYPQSHGRVL